MTNELLQKSLNLHKAIGKKKDELKNKQSALNCMRHENSKSAKIRLFSMNERGGSVNDDRCNHDFEIGELINIFQNSVDYLKEQIEELEHEFKKL